MKYIIKALLSASRFLNYLAEVARNRAIETAQAKTFKALDVRAKKEQARLSALSAANKRHLDETRRLNTQAGEIHRECAESCKKSESKIKEIELL